MLKPDVEQSAALVEEIKLWAHERLSAYGYTNGVEFVNSIAADYISNVIHHIFR